jgi:hypothetical protein
LPEPLAALPMRFAATTKKRASCGARLSRSSSPR